MDGKKIALGGTAITMTLPNGLGDIQLRRMPSTKELEFFDVAATVASKVTEMTNAFAEAIGAARVEGNLSDVLASAGTMLVKSKEFVEILCDAATLVLHYSGGSSLTKEEVAKNLSSVDMWTVLTVAAEVQGAQAIFRSVFAGFNTDAQN